MKCIVKIYIRGNKKIKDYLININNPVKNNNKARKYSVNFLTLLLLINFLKALPNNAQRLIVGKHIIAAVIVTKATPTKIFSSVGKKPGSNGNSNRPSFGLMNWNNDAS